MGEEHLDLLPELHRNVVLAGLGDVAGNLASVFMFFPADLARVGVGAAPGFGRARLADLLQSAVARGTLAGRSAVGVRIVAAELLEGVAPSAQMYCSFLASHSKSARV